MKNKIYILLFILAAFVSCDSYIEIPPSGIVSEEELYSSESGVFSALTKLYIDIPIEDFRFDQRVGFGRPNDYKFEELETITGLALNRKTDDAANLSGSSGFSWLSYGAIRNVNKFIINIEKYDAGLTPEKLKTYKAEAYIIRAWYYFAMAKRFGGVPYVTEVLEYNGPESVPFLQLPRNSEQETWDFILADIDKALEIGLPESNGKGRINKYVAYSLKAQTAIYAASIAKYNNIMHSDENTGKLLCGIPADKADHYFTIAFEAADMVISPGVYALATTLDAADKSENFRQVFLKIDDGKNKEVIMARYFSYPDHAYRFDIDRVPWGGQSTPNSCPTVDLIEYFDYLDGTPGTITTPVGEFTDEYDTREAFFAGRDARLLGSVMVPGSTFQGRIVDVKYGEISATGSEQTGVKYRGIYGMGEDGKTPTSMFQKKYVDDTKEHSSTENDSDQAWIAIRYAEILLIAAEAQIELGHPELAQGYINQIRTRAGLQELGVSDITRDEVRKQYICELAFENKTFWNYRRWRIFDEIMGSPFQPRGLYPYYDTRTEKWRYKVATVGKNVLQYQNKFYYNMIPSDHIQQNKNMFQNFGY